MVQVLLLDEQDIEVNNCRIQQYELLEVELDRLPISAPLKESLEAELARVLRDAREALSLPAEVVGAQITALKAAHRKLSLELRRLEQRIEQSQIRRDHG